MPVAESLTSFQMFIDGQWTDSARRDVFESDDPYLGKPWALTTGEWPKLTASKRGALLRRLGDLPNPFIQR